MCVFVLCLFAQSWVEVKLLIWGLNATFSIFFFLFICEKGRGTVVTGRIEQGTVKVGEEVEILGLKQVDSNTSHIM